MGYNNNHAGMRYVPKGYTDYSYYSDERGLDRAADELRWKRKQEGYEEYDNPYMDMKIIDTNKEPEDEVGRERNSSDIPLQSHKNASLTNIQQNESSKFEKRLDDFTNKYDFSKDHSGIIISDFSEHLPYMSFLEENIMYHGMRNDSDIANIIIETEAMMALDERTKSHNMPASASTMLFLSLLADRMNNCYVEILFDIEYPSNRSRLRQRYAYEILDNIPYSINPSKYFIYDNGDVEINITEYDIRRNVEPFQLKYALELGVLPSDIHLTLHKNIINGEPIYSLECGFDTHILFNREQIKLDYLSHHANLWEEKYGKLANRIETLMSIYQE